MGSTEIIKSVWIGLAWDMNGIFLEDLHQRCILEHQFRGTGEHDINIMLQKSTFNKVRDWLCMSLSTGKSQL